MSFMNRISLQKHVLFLSEATMHKWNFWHLSVYELARNEIGAVATGTSPVEVHYGLSRRAI